MVSSSKSREHTLGVDSAPVLTREPIIKQVLEQPQVAKIIEVKNVEVRSKQIVQEIREQPIIELEKRHITQNVQEQDIVKHERVKTQYEELTLGEQKPQLNLRQDTEVQTFKENNVRHVQDAEVKNVVTREVIERHIIPMVTEERHQKIINVIEQPIVRTIYKTPIIREVGATTQQRPVELAPVQPVQEPIPRASFVPRVNDLENMHEELHSARPLSSNAFREELGSFKLDHKLQKASFVPPVRELNRTRLNLHSAKPFASWEFKQEISQGHRRSYSEHDRASFVPAVQDLSQAKSHLHSAKPFASEDFKQELSSGVDLEAHTRAAFVPDEQDLLAQKLELTQAKPLSSNKFKQEIGAIKEELVDSSAWREGAEALPSTRVLKEKQLISAPVREGVLSTEEFKDELVRGNTLLHSAKPFAAEGFAQELQSVQLQHNTNPFASEEFREQIVYGEEVLRDTFPLSREGFAMELQAQKLRLEKSRYFSKPAFIGEFMAQKMLLKARTDTTYSREMAEIGDWKREHIDVIGKAKDIVADTVEYVTEKFHNIQDALGFGEKK